jgi:hypothetical protein
MREGRGDVGRSTAAVTSQRMQPTSGCSVRLPCLPVMCAALGANIRRVSFHDLRTRASKNETKGPA